MITSVNPELASDWDDQIRHLPGATFFHGAAWSRVLRDTYRFLPAHLADQSAEGITSLLPLFEVNSWLTGRRGVSLPFTDGCAPLARDPAAAKGLFEEAIKQGRARRWRTIELRGGEAFFADQVPAVRFHGHHLPLTGDADQLLARFDGSVRRAIRKAESSSLTSEISNTLEAVKEFYRLLGRTRQRHGLPPQPFRFFAAIQRHILAKGKGQVVVVRHGRTAVAAGIFFESAGTTFYKYGASDERFQEYRGNNLMMWAAMQCYLAKGCRDFDFGRTSLRNDGLRRFKLGWGAIETQISYFNYNLQASQFTTIRDEASGWYNRVFTHLPRACSRLIGAFLYKHIA